MSLNTFAQRFLLDRQRRGCNPATLKTYSYQLSSLVASLTLQRVRSPSQIQPRHLDFYLAALRSRNLSPVTLRKRILFLRSLFHFAKRSRYCRRDPTRNLTIPKSGKRIPKALTPADARRLLDRQRWIQDEDLLRDFAMVLLMLDSGLRREEIRLLNCEDVQTARCIVHVKHGKGDKERFSVFTRPTADALRAYLRGRRTGVLFENGGRRLGPLAIYRIVKRRGKQAGINVSPHRLRHTFITEYLNNGGNVTDARDLAGHDDVKTTMAYKAVAVAPLVRKHIEFSPLRHLRN